MEPLELLPTTLQGGETLYVESIVIDDATPATHALSYIFAAKTSATVAGVALEDGTGWSLTVPAATTLTWPSSRIAFTGYTTAITGGRVIAVDHGVIAVTASPAYVSWASTVLAAVDAAIAGRATDAQLSVTIGDMSVSKMTLESLFKARDWLAAEVRKDTANKMPRIIRARFPV